MSKTKPKVTKSLELLVKEEIVNTITHAVGIALSVAALTLLVVRSSLGGSAYQIVSFSIYGTTLVLLYLASTVYHSARNVRKKVLYNKLDHAAIYLLIAGTYTPFTLVTMKGAWGWGIFALQWTLAVVGVLFKLFFYTKKYRKLSALLYVLMGWAGIVGVHVIIQNLSTMGLLWLGLGCLSYSLSVFFYLWEHRLPFSHGIFHLFILAGSIFHFFSVLFYVA